MLGKILFHIISGIVGLYLSARFVPGVVFTGTIQTLILAGALLGLTNSFVRPILYAITLPLRILTLGLFTLALNMLLVWIVADILFPTELEIAGLLPLFWTTVIVSIFHIFFGLYGKGRKKD